MPSGEKVSGPGDLRLGTHATVWQGPISLGLGWRVKLPNAADEGGLGTDETDVTALGTISKGLGNAIVMAAGGVHVQGDPIRFANQDDVGLTWVGVASEIGAVQWFSQVGGTLRSSRNPARLSTELGVSYGCPLAVGGGVRKGLTPAAETWGGNLWVGFGAGCD